MHSHSLENVLKKAVEISSDGFAYFAINNLLAPAFDSILVCRFILITNVCTNIRTINYEMRG